MCSKPSRAEKNLFWAKSAFKRLEEFCADFTTGHKPPTQAQIHFSKICALGATPDELCLAELRARASPAATFEAFKNGTVATAAYCQMHDLAEAFYAALHLDNLVALKPGHDPREVASYTDGPDMAVGLEALQTLGVLQFQGTSTLEQRRRHIWHTLIHVVCAQCVKPELMVEVPLQDGTRIPLGGRPEIIARRGASRRGLDYFLRRLARPRAPWPTSGS